MSSQTSTPSSLEIRLLGPFRIEADGQPVEERRWSRRSAKLLIKLLALQPHHQLHREQIAELLWPNLEPDAATNELNKALHAARRALEPDLRAASESRFLLTQQQQLILRAPDGLWIDVEAFAQQAAEAIRSGEADALESALALYESDLLIEDLYEDWAAARREALRATRQELLLRLALRYEALGAYERSIERLKEMIVCEPADEKTHRRLMRLYAVTGNKFLAHQQYEQCRKALRDELDADPDPETSELSKMILLNQFQPITSGATMRQTVASVAPSQAHLTGVESGAERIGEALAPEHSNSTLSPQPADEDWQEHPATPPIILPVAESVASHSRRRVYLRPYALVICAAVLVALTAFGFRHLNSREESIDSLAVLPFINEGGDPETEYLAEGLGDAIIDKLARLPHLKVTARSAIRRYKGGEIDPLKVGRELGVRAVLTGQLARRNDKLNVRVEVVNVETGARLWGEQYDRPFAELLAVQDRIAVSVTEGLRASLTPAERKQLTRHYTDNAEAYRLYLKGRYFWGKRTREGFAKASDCFQQAIDLDPTYALAYVGLADCYNLSAEFRILTAHDAYGRSKAAIRKALELENGSLAEAYTSLGWAKFVYDWDWEGAEQAFQHALTLNPKYDLTYHWYSSYLSAMGRHDEAIVRVDQALEFDPLSISTHNSKGIVYYRAHRFDEAVEQFQKVIEMDPHHINAIWWLGLTYGVQARYAEAMAANNRAGELSRSDSPTSVYAEMGKADAKSGFQAYIKHLLDMSLQNSKKYYIAPTDIAEYYSALGDKNRALDWLDKGYEEHAPMMCFLKTDPRWDDLRDEPRFVELLRRMKLAS